MLAAVANVVLAEDIKPTTAMKRLIRGKIKPEERQAKEHQINADVRRLQEKWARSGDELLAAARKRAEGREEAARAARTTRSSGAYHPSALGGTAAEIARHLQMGNVSNHLAEMVARDSAAEAARIQGLNHYSALDKAAAVLRSGTASSAQQKLEEFGCTYNPVTGMPW